MFQGQLQGLRIAGLDDPVHLLLPGRGGDLQQGLQEAAADALGAVAGQYHQRELGPAVGSHILAVAQHPAIEADRQQRDAVALIDGVESAQQCQVGSLAMGKMALVKAGTVHRGQKIRDLLAVARAGGPDFDLPEIGGPGLAGAHDRAPAMNSAAALITAGSSSRRR